MINDDDDNDYYFFIISNHMNTYTVTIPYVLLCSKYSHIKCWILQFINP